MYPLNRVLERAAAYFPHRIAVVDGERRMSYRVLADRVHRLAGALLSLGLGRGDRVAILDWNSHRYLEAYYACAHANLAFMPVNSRLAPRELRYVLQDSDARAILFSEPFRPLYEEVAKGAAGLSHAIGLALPQRPAGVLDYEALLAEARPLAVPEPADAGEIAQIYYTSGTTGEPKGVCLTHGNMYAGGLDGVVALAMTREDSWLHAGPLFHLATSFAVWALPIVGGTQHVIHFEPKRAIELIARERVTMTSLPGAILPMVADMPETRAADISSLRRIVYGGSPTPMGVLRKAAAALPPALNHVYGITETAGFATSLAPADHVFDGSEAQLRRAASAGQATPFIDVRVVDDDGRVVPAGAVGEIVCGGPKIMSGYWRKPEATAAALRHGWYHTGDMGALDGEGFLTLVDRKKDMIISGGENVYSIEVESVISMHPGVAEVAVIGVPDERWGEAVTAIVVPRPGSEPSAEDLAGFCRGKIAGYKIPKSFEFRTEPLPKTGPGKIAKRVLRDPRWSGLGRKI
ncbi:MAG: long-chain-fatty-acid--CoA ligase [Candidatus Odyssella sp.]|nr:long-chain-fatty-acid--CoA ligase [Candidatus Odyssella sp.]